MFVVFFLCIVTSIVYLARSNWFVISTFVSTLLCWSEHISNNTLKVWEFWKLTNSSNNVHINHTNSIGRVCSRSWVKKSISFINCRTWYKQRAVDRSKPRRYVVTNMGIVVKYTTTLIIKSYSLIFELNFIIQC